MPDPDVQSLIDDPAIESVEIKLTVRADQEQMVHSALEREDVGPEKRQVYFFDTDDLDLDVGGDQQTKTRAALDFFTDRAG